MFLLLACSASQEPPPLHDVVLVVVETWRADRLKSWGSPQNTMPFVESLVAAGTLYERAWSPAPWTLPSVASMMTGLWPHETGVVRTEHALSVEHTTLAEAMGARGYQTAFFGVNEVFTHDRGLDQGYERFEGHTGWSANRLLQELGTLERDGRPLFLHLHLFEPHCPYWAPRSHRFSLPVKGDERVSSEQLAATVDCHRLPDGEDRLGAWFSRYDEELLALDEQLERLLQPYDQASVILVGDHGESFWEHGKVGHGTQLVEEVLHVPLVVRPPGGGRAHRVTEPISGREVYRLVLGTEPGSDVLAETSQVDPRACSVLHGEPTLCAAEPVEAPLVHLEGEHLRALEALGYEQVVPSTPTGEP